MPAKEPRRVCTLIDSTVSEIQGISSRVCTKGRARRGVGEENTAMRLVTSYGLVLLRGYVCTLADKEAALSSLLDDN